MLNTLNVYSVVYNASLLLALQGYPDPFARFLTYHHPVLDARLGITEQIHPRCVGYPSFSTRLTEWRYPLSFHAKVHPGIHLVLHGDCEAEMEKSSLEIPFAKIIVEIELGEPVEIIHL